MSATNEITSEVLGGGEGGSAETPSQPEREEQEVFNELADLCASPGYIHALANLFLLNNWITYKVIIPADGGQGFQSIVDSDSVSAALVRTSPGLLV
jgi:hypothetical protein